MDFPVGGYRLLGVDHEVQAELFELLIPADIRQTTVSAVSITT